MSKRFVSFLLVLLTLCTLAAPAALAEEILTITGITDNGDGTVTVTWDDPNQRGPYKVGWLKSTGDNYLIDLFKQDAWSLRERVAEHGVRLGILAPGNSYWVYVEDSTGYQVRIQLQRPEAQPFSGPQMTVVTKPRKQSSDGLSAFKTWSASAIQEAADAEYGIRLELTHGYMAEERNYYLQLTMTDPHGDRLMVGNSDFTTGGKFGSKTTFLNFFSFDWYFDKLVDTYGKIPQGTYTLGIYMDGGHVTDIPLEMVE